MSKRIREANITGISSSNGNGDNASSSSAACGVAEEEDWYQKRQKVLSEIASAVDHIPLSERNVAINARHGKSCARAESILDRAAEKSGLRVSRLIRWAADERVARYRYAYNKPRGICSQPGFWEEVCLGSSAPRLSTRAVCGATGR